MYKRVKVLLTVFSVLAVIGCGGAVKPDNSGVVLKQKSEASRAQDELSRETTKPAPNNY